MIYFLRIKRQRFNHTCIIPLNHYIMNYSPLQWLFCGWQGQGSPTSRVSVGDAGSVFSQASRRAVLTRPARPVTYELTEAHPRAALDTTPTGHGPVLGIHVYLELLNGQNDQFMVDKKWLLHMFFSLERVFCFLDRRRGFQGLGQDFIPTSTAIFIHCMYEVNFLLQRYERNLNRCERYQTVVENQLAQSRGFIFIKDNHIENDILLHHI